MSLSERHNMPDVSEPLDIGSIDDHSSLSQNSSPTNFLDGCLLSPASILPGNMTTPGTSTGSEGCETSAYIQLCHRHRESEEELRKTKQELESLKYVLYSLNSQ